MRVRASLRTFITGLTTLGLVATMVVVAPGVAGAALEEGEFVDQTPGGPDAPRDCSTAAYPGGVAVNPGSGADLLDLDLGTRQTFVPSIGRIDRIELCLTPVLTVGNVAKAILQGGSLDANFKVVIHQVTNNGGPIDTRTGQLNLANATVAGVLTQATAWYSVSLDPRDVDGDGIDDRTVFTPGATYAIELADPSIQFVWRATCGGPQGTASPCSETTPDHYPAGEGASALSGTVAVGDFGFRTISTAGADLVGELAFQETRVVCPDASTFRDIDVVVTNAGSVSTAPTDARLTAQGPGNTAPVDLGTAPIPSLWAGQSVVLDFNAFSNRSAVEQLAGTGLVELTLTVDAAGVVTEIAEANNVIGGQLPIMDCAEGALITPAIAIEGGGNTIRHGITRIPFADLETDEIAAIASTFGGQSTIVAPEDQSVEPGVQASPLYQSPLYQSPLYQSPLYQSSVAGSPLYQSPLYQSPLYQSPLYQSPLYQSPLYQSPVAGSPLYQSPLYQSPLYQSPLYQSPLYQSSIGSNLGVLLAPLPDVLMDAIPIIMVPADWPAQLSAVGREDLLDRPSQELTLLDMEQAGVLDRMKLSDADLSKALRLDVATALLGPARLGDLPVVEAYAKPDGTNDLCAIISDATHLDCGDVAARYGSIADASVIELALADGVRIAALPFVYESLAEVATTENAETGTTGLIVFDTPVAHTGYRTATDTNGLPLTLPAQGHAHLFATPLGGLTIHDAFSSLSVVDCDVLAQVRGFASGDADACGATTVAQVEAAYAFDEDVARDVGDLLEAVRADLGPATSLIALAPAFVPFNNLPWSRADLARLDTPTFQNRAGLEQCAPRSLTVSARVDEDGGSVFDPTLDVGLVGGFDLAAVVSATRDGSAVTPSDVIVTPQPDAPYARTKRIGLTVPGIASDLVSVTFDVCAADLLGEFDVTVESATWETFVEDPGAPTETRPDWLLEVRSAEADDLVSLRVVEEEEPSEGAAGTTLTQVNTLVVRHITEGETDLFRIPSTGLVDADGVEFDLREGSVVIATLAPPSGALQQRTAEDGSTFVIPDNSVNLDLAAFVTGSSDLVDDSFGLTKDLIDVAYVDPPAFPVADNTVVEGPNSTVSPSPLYQSPLYQSPLYQSPLYQSDVEPSPLYQSPLYQSGYDRPARAISNNRGDAYEQVAVQIESGEVGEDILLEVSGVLGASSDRSYKLWLTVLQAPVRGQCDPVLAPADIPSAGSATVPTLQPGDETLILFNPQVAVATHGTTMVAELGQALHAFAQEPEVNGVVVNPMLDDDYDAAMRAWLTTEAWCSPPAANEVAGLVRRLVQEARLQTVGPDGEPTLKYVMVFGDDSQQPYWRIRDDRPEGNAREMAVELLARTGQNNPLLAAAAESFFVTDDPMVTSQVRLASDRPIFIPDVVSSRVFGDPMAMIYQLAAWGSAGNEFGAGGFALGDGPTVVTGEGPFADGAASTVEDLQLLGFEVDAASVNDGDADPDQLSHMDELRASLRGDDGATPSAAFMFQHTDPWRIQSAYGTATGEPDLLESTELLTEELSFGHVLAATNCNFNLQVPAAYHAALSAALGTDARLDLGQSPAGVQPAWADLLGNAEVGGGATIAWAAATSYGYGVQPGIDLTEELVLLTEQYTARGLSFGEAVLRAKVRQFVGQSEYDEYNYKALATFQVNGFPMARQSDAAPFEPDTIFTPEINETGDGVVATAALQSPDLAVGAVGQACTECLLRVDTADGHYYTAVTDSSFGGAGAAGEAPIVPQVSTIYDFGGRQVGGVLITAIETEFAQDIPGDPASVDDFDFVYESTQLSGGDLTPANNGLDVKTWFAPRFSTFGDEVTVTSARAQAKGKYVDSSGQVRGLYLLNTSVNGEITFVPEGEDLPANAALVTSQQALRSPTGTTIALEWTTMHERPTHRAVGAILVSRKTAGDVPIDPRWIFRSATIVDQTTVPAGDGVGTVHLTTWRSLFPVAADHNLLEHLTQTVDATGRVNFSVSPTLPSTDDYLGGGDPPPAVTPNPVVTGNLLPSGFYDGSATVTLVNSPSDDFDVSIDGGPYVQRPGGHAVTFTEPGLHTYKVKAQYGTEITTINLDVDTAAPEVEAITPYLPAAGQSPQVFLTYQKVPLEYRCSDDVGIVACYVLDGSTHVDTATITPVGQVRTVTYVAVDTAGRVTTLVVPYVVRSSLSVVQFDPPIKGDFVLASDGSVIEAQYYTAGGDNTIPFKFEVFAPNGESLGLLPSNAFNWRLLGPNGNLAGYSCQASSTPGYHIKGAKHQFNALTSCHNASGGLVRDHVSGERWRFEVRLPDGFLLYADVTYS